MSVLAAVLLTVASGASEPTATAGDRAQPFGDAAGEGASSAHTLTLITGDAVHVEEVADGRRAVAVEPADGRDDVGFHHMEVDGDLLVVPLDAVGHLGSGALDEALFNIDTLIDEGHHDAATDELPIIVGYGERGDVGSLGTAESLPGAQAGSLLESINGRAVAVDKAQASSFWESVRGSGAAAQGQGELAAAVERVWLDRTVEATLDRSVSQVGAPDAWDAGIDGQGVTVAVLDSGIDTTHPDLDGKVVDERNFSTSPDTVDRLGHGTHVAATIAGTGAGSNGERAGVAPGADLLSGKVLNDFGSGSASDIIDGMEWAIDAGADIVNMSLGGAPTDGSDPLSVAVNKLTEQTGTLFVVSAGNSGPGAMTVTSPGSADAALTVGAIDRDASLASFSSRGPRLDDLAIKPDITAPGVGIIAARAAGTSMGSPIDDSYTAASGTSMSAPHVAGAAALLLQHHAGWEAGDLQDGLVSTAAPADDQTVFEQGGGLLDIARAVEQGVYATGTLDLGTFQDDEDRGEATTEVSYTNTTEEDVELDLDLSLESQSGGAVDGGVRVDDEQVVIPAGQTATVEVVVDPGALARGVSTGRLTASSPDLAVRTALAVVKEAPRHTVTFSGIGPDGEPASLVPLTVRGEDPRFDDVTQLPPCCTRTLELAEGTYHVFGQVTHTDEQGEAAYAIVNPSLEVTEDAEVVLDARDANEVIIETPRPTEAAGTLSFYAYRAFGGRGVADGVMHFPSTERLFVTPTDEVAEGSFEFNSRWQLSARMLTAEVQGGPDIDLDLRYLAQSPLLEGRRTLPVVAVGEGAPADYEGVDVDDAIALVAPEDPPDYFGLTAVAAEAGAALAIFIPPESYGHWQRWNPDGPRLPTLGALVPRLQGERLLDQLEDGRTRLRVEGSTDQPYLYDVVQVAHGGVPDQVVHTVDASNSATVETSYHDLGGQQWAAEQRFGWRPWMGAAINQFHRPIKSGQVREEVVSAGGTLWQHRVRHDDAQSAFLPLSGGLTQAPRTYEAGAREAEDWHRSVLRPAIPRAAEGTEALESYREGDILTIQVPEFADASPGHYGRAGHTPFGVAPDEVTASLYQDGELVVEDRAAWGTYAAAPEPAEYRLDLSVRRDQPTWEFSPATGTSWTFASQRPDEGRELLPLLQIDYDADVDLRNRAPSGRAVPLRLTARHQDGLDGPEVARMEVSVSFDSGEDWEPLRVVDQGKGRFQAVVRHPRLDDTDGYVSLRVEAEDAAGNRVRQTVERAYGLTGR